GGQLEKLKVEQCKLYLRKHGLRLTGKKDVLIHRIKEHISIVNGGGEHKYPASSFVMNCKGDACTGDVVMFEQNVYEMFNIASRSASGPPCGTRVVAGRIVKESYGAAKQQHTFTIEVLWSKGVKPLPPLHPLLIKGRNLYRLKTMRQRWEDESQREKILSEKHCRGNAARTSREARLQEKEAKKALRESRALKGKIQNDNEEKTRKTSPPRPVIHSRYPTKQDSQNNLVQHAGAPFKGVLGSHPLASMVHDHHGGSYKENVNSNVIRGRGEPNGSFKKGVLGRHPLANMQVEQEMNFHPSRYYERRHEYDHETRNYRSHNRPPSYSLQQYNNGGHSPRGHYERRHDYDHETRNYHSHNRPPSYSLQQDNNVHLPIGGHYQGHKQQLCRYYAQGRCHYGTNCRYLH
ncbi:uncharacterized protein, partial [Rutidosis leptorrhynchoides]|uniref:uncharacterized protein n=1 Tax=Rutidosis leptorrhynchoides TaxID=125765 RepID=UPI003A98F336